MSDEASVEGISRLLGKLFTIASDHTKLPILAAADDDTSEDDNGTF